MTRWKSDDEMGVSNYGTLIESLAIIEAQQADFPGMWGEVSRYTTENTAAVTANKLRKKYPVMWEFRSQTDKDTGEGVVWARYTPPDYTEDDVE